ncbi:unknown protein [Waddlia chondrophila 2032/99]|uniref:Uncharacterized protein n=1 Tax=Waddlia chondrophila 2032/99 TaxID=765953 RepID=F8LCK8_9BACT|nr:unknown protein [Waddlia chondrophila 2032/99]
MSTSNKMMIEDLKMMDNASGKSFRPLPLN